MFKIAIVSAAGGGSNHPDGQPGYFASPAQNCRPGLGFGLPNLLSTLGSDEVSLNGLLPDFLTRKEFGKSALINSNELVCLPFGRANESAW